MTGPCVRRVVELSLTVTVASEAKAVTVAEILARNMIGLLDDDVTAVLGVDRYEQVCAHEHDEVEP